MRVLMIMLLATVLTSCAYHEAPTAPTPIAAAQPTRDVYALELITGAPDLLGVARLGVRTRDIDGVIIGADVQCSTSAGRVLPARFNSGSRGAFELDSTTTRARVSCRAGDAQDTIDVDMSAWDVEFLGATHEAVGELGGLNRVLIAPAKRIDGVPLTRVSLAWGDGAVDVSPIIPLSTPALLQHRYGRAGLYVITAAVAWADGTTTRQITIFGGPAGSSLLLP